jgi:TetR/AcrR family transcriptional repressor of nem operon
MKADDRERLARAARELLIADSYEACTVEAAARAAGLDATSAQAAVRDRVDLVLAALDAHWAELRPHVAASLDASHPPLERLRRWFAGAADFQAANWSRAGCVVGCLLIRVGSSAGKADVAVRLKVATILDDMTAMLVPALNDAMSEGRIRKGDPDVMARTLVQYAEGVLGLARIDNDLEALKSAMARGLEFLGAEPAVNV